MRISIKQTAALAAASTLALGGVAAVADAATHVKRAVRTSGASSETVLTGAALTSASDAAIAAVPGGTVTRASTENPSDTSGAAYEVHVRKSDGTQVEVLEDASFKVLSVSASAGHGPGPGH